MWRTCWRCWRRAWASARAPMRPASAPCCRSPAGRRLARSQALPDQVAGEARDASLEALDKVWEEEQVNFLPAEQQERCPSQASLPGKAREEGAVPLHWVDFNTGPAAPGRETAN